MDIFQKLATRQELINRELDNLTGSDPATLERQAELFDALLSCNGGMGPARRAMCERKQTNQANDPDETGGTQ